MKDFSKIRYLKINAEDPYECVFRDVIIDLVEDTLVSGTIMFGSIEENEDRYTVNIRDGLDDLPNNDASIFAKVVDNGIYHLLDDEMNEVFVSEGYVPNLMDYYNVEQGYGDYIDIRIENTDKKKLHHKQTSKITFNDVDDWTEVERETQPNMYAKGMCDAFVIVKKTLIGADTPEIGVADVLNLIANFKTRRESN